MNNDIYERRVKDVMSRDVVTIDAKDTVHERLQLMAENKVSALPVVDRQGRCIGIISTSDLIDVTRDLEAGIDELERADELFWGQFVARIGDGVGHRNVQELMSEEVVSTRPEALLSDAAGRMLRDRIHRLPVVDNERRLLGIISTTDILAAFVDCTPAKAT